MATAAVVKKKKPEADKCPPSKPTPRMGITPFEESIVRKFAERGRALDKPVAEFLELAVKVRAIFAACKIRDFPVAFEGHSYMSFDKFVEACCPVSARTMRRWLAKEGKTDKRFANKPRSLATAPPALPEATPAAMTTARVAEPERPALPEADKCPPPKPTLGEWRERSKRPACANHHAGRFKLKYFEQAATYFWDGYQQGHGNSPFRKALQQAGSPKHRDDLVMLAGVLRSAAENLRMLADAVEPSGANASESAAGIGLPDFYAPPVPPSDPKLRPRETPTGRTITLNNGKTHEVFPSCGDQEFGVYFCCGCNEHRMVGQEKSCQKAKHELLWHCDPCKRYEFFVL